MELEIIDKNINEILDGRKNLPKFNQPEHAGVCSAGPLLIGALIVCDKARESISTSSDAPNGEAKTPSNWEIDEPKRNGLQNGPKQKVCGFPKQKIGSQKIMEQK